MPDNTLQYLTIPKNTSQYLKIPYNTLEYLTNTIKYLTIPYKYFTIPYNQQCLKTQYTLHYTIRCAHSHNTSSVEFVKDFSIIHKYLKIPDNT